MSRPSEEVVVAILFPADAERRPAMDRERDVAALRALDPRVRVIEVDYPRPANGRARTKQERAQLNQIVTPALGRALAEAEVVLAFDIPTNLCELAPRLRWIQAISAETSHLCTPDVLAHDVRITSSAGTNAASVAEFAITRLLMAWKRVSRLEELQERHEWGEAPTRELSGSRVGVLGYGAIAQAVVARLAAFDVDVWLCRRSAHLPADAPGISRVFGLVDRLEFVAGCDAVIAALPDALETRGLFDGATFAAMKDGAFFCNVGRGSLVDERALSAALRAGHLSGAAVDVVDSEPLDPTSELWDVPNLMISPHVAASMDHFYLRVFGLLRTNMGRYLAGESLLNEVARPASDAGALTRADGTSSPHSRGSTQLDRSNRSNRSHGAIA